MLGQKVRSTRQNAVRHDSQLVTPFILRCDELTDAVTVVPPLYQLVLVAATEGSIFHVIVTAADCDGRTSVTCE